MKEQKIYYGIHKYHPKKDYYEDIEKETTASAVKGFIVGNPKRFIPVKGKGIKVYQKNYYSHVWYYTNQKRETHKVWQVKYIIIDGYVVYHRNINFINQDNKGGN